ncbi:FAD-dependent 5-carboxymethylaminomethyl-2-thiouridine(34) oxidoreductase MnmC [Ottowia sp.]|uniref:FAD-dependent 5-carboxymethylaminomethyl-2-thiouridine(34) oxidoreductase MnmC n=1 Tax=Ottowia sp. TaxID=1898956 RepID=UPI002C455ECD|nr:FAD-dependent 5-carboxymethylaminomethyl-2-thiouridine(34) oxidoreductase MnmC [Ottowia sp.]HOB65553.1 FAD-dependent 5-carboxymethylaminomethyl-2-thiouridine(34) oxidoreductase MnmC [Ottowia sp.]HPZ58021.1 FAD-dependent 5-carboxymethylaminomethyl-2-thiouridine(34) oxidoreductase MnmC [Ottowia sp.]HQD46655.1 FAD-dependent 5-carboxymethylaminomethyl-2-thiouridine(34) oxidoreductase MnmC [Ottowia sp.]
MPDDTAHRRADGTLADPHVGDIHRRGIDQGEADLTQARQVFLQGCGLLGEGDAPTAWQGAARWAVLDTSFGMGRRFFATWYAWQQQRQRPARLFYTAVEAAVPEAQDLVRSASPFGPLAPLAAELAAQWHGLLPGVHRLRLDGGRVQLTLAVGAVQPMLAELAGEHDSIFLHRLGTDHRPEPWNPHTLKAVARLARPGARAAGWGMPCEVRQQLAACGFVVEPTPELPQQPQALRALYAPRWAPRPRRDAAAHPVATQPARCAVVGAGLAGAAVARALALRGWQVTVLDRAPEPAAGASGLPAGVVAAHVSPDDRPLSRLTRAGARATLAAARELLQEGIDFAATGVLERHAPGERRLPAKWQDAIDSEAAGAGVASAEAPITQEKAAQADVPLNAEQRALWHTHAGWLRPAALVRALLQTPGITWRGAAPVARIAAAGTAWQLADAAGALLAEAELVVVTAGFDSLALLQAATPAQDARALPLHALRGQVALGAMPGGAADALLPRFPVNGHGSLVAHLPGPDGAWWVTGSTFERGNPAAELRAQDHDHNRERLAQLLPAAAAALDAQWRDGRARAWAAVRATLPDRLPAVGAWRSDHEQKTPPALDSTERDAIELIAKEEALPLHLLTGLGARGLTLSLLAADILAAWLHGEPLPVERSLAHGLRAARWHGAAPPRP